MTPIIAERAADRYGPGLDHGVPVRLGRRPRGLGHRLGRAVLAGYGPGRAGEPGLRKVVAAFAEAIEASRTGEPIEARSTARSYRADFTPPDHSPADMRRVRDLLGMSQAVFAGFLSVGANTVRSWEQGTQPPPPIARRFLAEIEADPDHWRRRIDSAGPIG